MKKALIIDGIVVQVDCSQQAPANYIDVPDHIVCGMKFDGKEFVTPPVKKTWDEIRDVRDFLLKESDWTALTDVPLSDDELEKWRSYRKQLRDVTNQENPDNISWPEKP